MKCPECAALKAENKELRERNAKLASLLGRPHSNTDMILGAALSGGDALGLAKELVEKQKKV